MKEALTNQKMIVDTHIHTWNFGRARYLWLEGNTSILNRTYHVAEIEKERSEQGITQGVLVQAANNFEDTDWMLDVADAVDWIKGVVGWLPLVAPDATALTLQEKYLINPYFKGVRHLIHDEPDPQWLLQSNVIESLRMLADKNIPYDVVGVLPEHIRTVLRIAELIPNLRMVFDHLNNPWLKDGSINREWETLMKAASGNPNFYAKISGLGTACGVADWKGNDIKPVVGFIMDTFGTDRCFLGGDWPVSLLAGAYSKTWTNYKEVITELLDDDEKEKVLYRNAIQFYNL